MIAYPVNRVDYKQINRNFLPFCLEKLSTEQKFESDFSVLDNLEVINEIPRHHWMNQEW